MIYYKYISSDEAVVCYIVSEILKEDAYNNYRSVDGKVIEIISGNITLNKEYCFPACTLSLIEDKNIINKLNKLLVFT